MANQMNPAPNAILAINSLDRYITSAAPPVTTNFRASWLAGQVYMVLDFLGPNPGVPRVGGILSGITAYNVPDGTVQISRVQNIYTLQGQLFEVDIYLTLVGTNTPYTLPGGNPMGFVQVNQTIIATNANQPTSTALISQYQENLPFSNNFTIQSPNALIYGYIDRIIVSQIQLQYNIPTVVQGKNDSLWIQSNDITSFTAGWFSGATTLTLLTGNPVIGSTILGPPGYFSPGTMIVGVSGAIITISQPAIAPSPPITGVRIDTTDPPPANIIIPHGFYYADELAATVEALILALGGFWAAAQIDVVFTPRDGFVFTSTSIPPITFYFPTPTEILSSSASENMDRILKTYKLFGFTIGNSNITPLLPGSSQTSIDYPNFLYTPYIDIYSDVLTNYQNVKDTNTSIQKPKGLLARIYVSGTGQIQITDSITALGTAPFVMTADLNTPKVIRWEPNVAVPSIDFQLLDQYGEQIPGAEQGFSTEFQMTLLCIEGEQ